MTNGPESAEAPRRSRRAADVPVDSPAGPRERESQQRARDREALRAYKALSGAPERRDSETVPPTRRQLRLRQQRAAAAAGRPGPGVPEAAPADGLPTVEEAPASEPAASEPAASEPAASEPAPSEPAASGSVPEPDGAGEPLRRERRRRSQAVPNGEEQDPEVSPSGAHPAHPEEQGPVTRRQARIAVSSGRESGTAATVSVESASTAGPAADVDPNADVEGMSVEQALAARQALEGQARNQVAAMEAVQAEDPHAVDLELLAQQKALAERAMVLNRRTEAIQKLSQENEQRRASSTDPAAAHNLAMVTPLEFVQVPGVEHPVMKAPPTSHIPIVTASTAAPAATEADVPRAAGALPASPAPAEEAARPVGARSAFGLDPLDVMTAGLGRTRKLRFAVAGVAGLGTLALIVGVLMIVGGLGG